MTEITRGKAEEKETFLLELTEDEIDVISIAVRYLSEEIDNGNVVLEMSENNAYELGRICGGLIGLDCDECDED